MYTTYKKKKKNFKKIYIYKFELIVWIFFLQDIELFSFGNVKT